MEGRGKKGEGPCNLTTGACKNSKNRGAARPDPVHGGHVQLRVLRRILLPKGTRPVTISGRPGKEYEPVSTCDQNQFENGDLDFDGTGYRKGLAERFRQVPADVPVPGPVHERACVPADPVREQRRGIGGPLQRRHRRWLQGFRRPAARASTRSGR